MINAHFKPSDELLKEIEQAVKCYLCKGNLTKYGDDRYTVCIKICKEAGIENPNQNDIIGVLPAFNYHAQKVIDAHLSEKYKNDRT